MTFGDGLAISADGYTEAGMVISATTNVNNPIQNWQVPAPATGERELLDNDGASYVFSLSSGGIFDLMSLDVEDPFGTGPHWSSFGSVDIIGSNGAIVNLLATAFGTHAFGSSFIGITSFEVQYASSSQLTFDNVEFKTTSSVPEPASIALLGLGLAGIGFSRKKTE